MTIKSSLHKRDYFSVVLFDQLGEALGTLKLSLSRMFLTGCVSCGTPKRLAAAAGGDGGKTEGSFEIKGTELIVTVGGERVVKEMSSSCARKYGGAAQIAFSGTDCSNEFVVKDSMVLGELVDETCAGTCV